MACHKGRKGTALLISMIVLAILSAWAVSIYSMSGANVQLAENQRKADSTRACAESGLEVIRFWLNRFSVAGTTDPSLIFEMLKTSLQSDLEDNEILNITPIYYSSSITVPSVPLDSANGQSFSATIAQSDPNTLQVDATGAYGSITRTIKVNYELGTRKTTVFDFGVATKGPLHMAGSTEFDGVNIAGESDIYIESDVNYETLSILGNSQIAGNVSFTSTDPDIELGGTASIGGNTAPEAYNHVFTSVRPAEFPAPDPCHFWPYVESTFDPETTTDTLENVMLPAGTYHFENVTIKGVLFIESPSIVTFTGSTTVYGTIIGNGDLDDDSGTNQISFGGNVVSFPISALAGDPNFASMQDETGTFIMAPGFSVSFGGNFDTLNGAIAANGIEFSGGAGGTINGSVINYSDTPMSLTGNSEIYFNRSGTTEMPAGFVPEIVLLYDPTSYSEIVF